MPDTNLENPFRPMTQEESVSLAKKKNPEEKKYLILFSYDDDSEVTRSWEVVVGRTEARKIIIDNIELIDVDESHILVEGHAFGTEISIYDFMKHIESFYEDSFDIDDYTNSYYVEESEEDDLPSDSVESDDLPVYDNVHESIVNNSVKTEDI